MFKAHSHHQTESHTTHTMTPPTFTGKGMQQTIKLEPQGNMPTLGLGTMRINSKDCIKKAVEAGYRMFDCGSFYGNEAMVGEALNECIKSGIVRREDLFICSKLWCTQHEPKYVMEACQRALKDLRMDYLDMFSIHFPVSMDYTGSPPSPFIPKDGQGHLKLTKVPLHKTWKAMEDLVKKGLVKSIGVCNFRLVELLDLLSCCEIRPCTNQIEVHPYYNRESLVKECHWLGIPVVGYCPLGSNSQNCRVLDDQTIMSIASKYNKSPAQVCLRWSIQRGIPCIPKSIHEDRLRENCNIFDFHLTDEDMNKINGLNKNVCVINPKDIMGFDLFTC